MCSVLKTPHSPSPLQAEGSRAHGLVTQLVLTTNEVSHSPHHWGHRFLTQALQSGIAKIFKCTISCWVDLKELNYCLRADADLHFEYF